MNTATLTAIDAALREERSRAIEAARIWSRNNGLDDVVFRMIRKAYPDTTSDEYYYGHTPTVLMSVPAPSDVVPGLRTCECDGCTDTACEGGCDSCEVHTCSQCHGSGVCDSDCSTCHDPYSCCGYCEQCDSHHDGYDDEVCNKGHCHECEHICANG